MTRNLTATIESNGVVKDVVVTGGSRFRFTRNPPYDLKYAHQYSEEREQEMCAMYVDHPEMTWAAITEYFKCNPSSFWAVLSKHGVPRRDGGEPMVYKRRRQRNRKKPLVQPEVTTQSVPLMPTTGAARWRVTVTKTIIEEIMTATDQLLEVAAIYDGTGAVVVRAERI